VFMNPNEGYFTATYEGVPQPGEPQDSVAVMEVYWTKDGGRTWNPAAGLARDTGWRGNAQFVSLQDGFTTCGKGLCVTQDAGQTWQPIVANIDLNAGSPDRALIGFDFIDESIGWALFGMPDGTTALYETLDGGVTWNPLNPSLAAIPSSQPQDGISLQTAGMVTDQASWGKGTLQNVVFSPDGKRLGVVSALGVYIYDADNFKQLSFTPGAPGFTTAAFSPDWKRMALAAGSGIALMGLDEAASLQTLSTKQGVVTGLLYSPDGAYLASLVQPPGGEVYNRLVELWQMSSGQLVTSWDAGSMPQVAFSADSKAFYAWNPFRMAGVRSWEIPSGAVLSPMDTLNPAAMAFSPDGKRMASYDVTDSSGTIAIQPVGGGPARRVSGGKPGAGELLRFSPDSNLLASFLPDGTVQVYKALDGSLVSSFDAGSASVSFLAFSPDSASLALPTPDGVAIYAVSGGQPLRSLGDHYGALRQAAISPQGDRVAGVFDAVDEKRGGLAVWDLPEGRLEYLFPNLGGLTLAWAPDGQRLAVAGWDGKIKVLPATGGALQMTLPGHSEQVQSLAWSPDGAWLASTAMQSLKLWRAVDGHLEHEIVFTEGWVNSVRFSPDSTLVAAVSASGAIGVWQVSDGKKVTELPGSPYSPMWLDFAPGGTFLAVGQPTMVSLWLLDKSEAFQTIAMGTAPLAAMRLSPDGTLIAGGLQDGRIRLWQVPQGNLLRTLPGIDGAVISLDFSADGSQLLAAGRDGTFRVFAVKR
jgi:WD40 repeat protein